MPKLHAHICFGRVPKGEELKRLVENNLQGKGAADYVIALTDVYTGTNPPEFKNALDTKTKMALWVGDNPRFIPHAAQYEFEAWLLPFWPTIKRRARSERARPDKAPEDVNHGKPPAKFLAEVYHSSSPKKRYNKPIEAAAILKENDLSVAIEACPELKAFINSILRICGKAPLALGKA